MVQPVVLFFLNIWTLCPVLTFAAFINVKQHKCSAPRDPVGMKPVLIADLPFYTVFTVSQYVQNLGSHVPNKTLILDKYFPEEWAVLQLSLQKLTRRVAIVTVVCPSIGHEEFFSHFMLVQSVSRRTMWIKQVTEKVQNFHGFSYGWTQAFLMLEPLHEAFVFKACAYRDLRMVIASPLLNRTRLRCSRFDSDGQRRLKEAGMSLMKKFEKLARRITAGRISYPDGFMRLFLLKLLIGAGFSYGYFLLVLELLKKVIR